jgi:glycosyltransferase involved in cell wall biosynthesis
MECLDLAAAILDECIQPQPSICVAICTRNHPDDLQFCISTVTADPLLSQIIISSDGIDIETDRVVMKAVFSDPRVDTQRGPRLGPAANRNACVDVCRTDFIIFLEDTAQLATGLVRRALKVVNPWVIVTGFGITQGDRVAHYEYDILGFQRVVAGPSAQAIHMNTAVFPVNFLRKNPFHEGYRGGGEDIDMALLAIRAGLTIVQIDAGIMCDSSSVQRKRDSPNAVFSRGLLCALRYRLYERSFWRLVVSGVFGPLNVLILSDRPLCCLSFVTGFASGLRRRDRRPPFPRPITTPAALSLSVVVPTYRRADRLKACLDGLTQQLAPPDEVIVVRRREDRSAAEVVSQHVGLSGLRETLVERPGQVAALLAGSRSATGDIIALIDDDVVCRPDWSLRVRRWFSCGEVAGLGGRDIVHRLDGSIEESPAKTVGMLGSWGDRIGNHHLGSGRPRWVDILKGCNVAYRRAALAFPRGLRGAGAEVANDMATSLYARSRGFGLVYDPTVLVDHYPAERFDDDKRGDHSPEARLNGIRNEVAAIVSARPHLALRYTIYHAVIGDRAVPGLIRVAIGKLRNEGSSNLRLSAVIGAVAAEAWKRRREPLEFDVVSEGVEEAKS